MNAPSSWQRITALKDTFLKFLGQTVHPNASGVLECRVEIVEEEVRRHRWRLNRARAVFLSLGSNVIL
jgi:hypothetical protein